MDEDLCNELNNELPSVDCTKIENFYLDSPSNILIMGPSQAGKTYTTFELIRHFPSVFKNCGIIKNIVIVYGAYEHYYDSFVKELKDIYEGVNIVVIEGFYLDKILASENFEYSGPGQESILLIGKLLKKTAIF